MYKVRFTKEVVDVVINDFRLNITNRMEWRLARAEEAEFSTLEVWIEMINTLKNTPRIYTEYNNVYLGIELYMPYVLLYKIIGKDVIVFKALSRNQLYPS